MSEDLPAAIGPDGAAERRAQLRHALMLVEGMAGGPAAAPPAAALHPGPAYRDAAPVARRRFDAVVGEAGRSAAAGIAALIRHRAATGRDCAAAAEHLAEEMRRAIAALDRIAGG